MPRTSRVLPAQRVLAIGVGLVITTLCAACVSSTSTPPTDSSAGPVLTVAASIYPIEEVVSRVGGANVRVIALTPPGEDPHDRDLTAKQLDSLAGADIVFYLGEGFQPSVDKAVDSLDKDVAKVDLLGSVTLLDAPDHADDIAHAHGEHDPHIWLDPANMAAMARTVATTIIAASRSAAHGADISVAIDANRDAYITELDALGTDIDSGLANCESRALVTAHNAFGYLARRAKLDTFSISGLNPNEEPSAKDLENLASVIRGRNVTVVYYETLLPGDVAKTIAQSVGVSTDLLDPVENISASDRRAGATYLTLQRDNLARLVKGLRCS